MKPYGLFSDAHLHDWSVFSSVDSKGRNTRLMGILSEIDRCFGETKKAGGDTVVFGGDLIHTRGRVEPSVFNPAKDMFSKWSDLGMKTIGICGNHDLASRESVELHSSVAMLNGIPGFEMFHKTSRVGNVVLVPWYSSPSEYMKALQKASDENEDRDRCDLICHIGIDGTLRGMPDHGVTAETLAKLGFKRVFSGHYHNHRDFGNGVFSVGATTHQTWGDVGTKAGFMIVSDTDQKFFASRQPNFISLTRDEYTSEELPLVVPGNFIQAKISGSSNKEAEGARKLLTDLGAKGVSIILEPKTVSKREKTSVESSSVTVAESVDKYCKAKGYEEKIVAQCNKIVEQVL